jgi:hypothetical protein
MIAIARRIDQAECPLLCVPPELLQIGVGRSLHLTIPAVFIDAIRMEKLSVIGSRLLDLGGDEAQCRVGTVQLPLEKLRTICVHFHQFRPAAATENAH